MGKVMNQIINVSGGPSARDGVISIEDAAANSSMDVIHGFLKEFGKTHCGQNTAIYENPAKAVLRAPDYELNVQVTAANEADGCYNLAYSIEELGPSKPGLIAKILRR